MKCVKCGREFQGHFCPSCGTPAPKPGQGYKAAAAVLIGYGVIAFFVVALPAFASTPSSAVVATIVCLGFIAGGVACIKKYKALSSQVASGFGDGKSESVTERESEAASFSKEEGPEVQKEAPELPKEPTPTELDRVTPDSGLSALKKYETFHVAGITHKQKEIFQMAYENEDYSMSKKEIIDSGKEDERIYKYEFDPVHVELIPEPDNPYDPKAIKVVIDGVHVGYIKKGSTSRVRNLLKAGGKVSAEIKGGPYKVLLYRYEDGEDRYDMETGETSYFVSVQIEK